MECFTLRSTEHARRIPGNHCVSGPTESASGLGVQGLSVVLCARTVHGLGGLLRPSLDVSTMAPQRHIICTLAVDPCTRTGFRARRAWFEPVVSRQPCYSSFERRCLSLDLVGRYSGSFDT